MVNGHFLRGIFNTVEFFYWVRTAHGQCCRCSIVCIFLILLQYKYKYKPAVCFTIPALSLQCSSARTTAVYLMAVLCGLGSLAHLSRALVQFSVSPCVYHTSTYTMPFLSARVYSTNRLSRSSRIHGWRLCSRSML